MRNLERRLKALANRKRLEILKFLKREHSASVTLRLKRGPLGPRGRRRVS